MADEKTTTPKLRDKYGKPKNKAQRTWLRDFGTLQFHELAKEDVGIVFDKLLDQKRYNDLEEFFVWKRPKE